jgi:predicted phosphodiesterase
MRYGIFSDIHSNLEALEAVLEAFAEEGVEQYVSVGDIVGYGADPSQCIAIVEGLPCLVVAGNHDWAVSDLHDPRNFNEAAREAVLWTEAVLTWEEIGYLKSLGLIVEQDALTLVHGSLDHPDDFNYILTARDSQPTFELMKTPLCLIGHSHIPAIFRLTEKGIKSLKEHRIKIGPADKYIVNVGSVGQPRDGDPRAAYAIYDDAKRTLEIKRVKYDIKKAQEKILNAGLPSVLAYRLSTGT